VFVTLQYMDPSGHHAALGSARARIEATRATSHWYAWGTAGALFLVWAIVLVLHLRRTQDAPT